MGHVILVALSHTARDYVSFRLAPEAFSYGKCSTDISFIPQIPVITSNRFLSQDVSGSVVTINLGVGKTLRGMINGIGNVLV